VLRGDISLLSEVQYNGKMRRVWGSWRKTWINCQLQAVQIQWIHTAVVPISLDKNLALLTLNFLNIQ
jgi:hypothetical protein